MTTGNVLKKGRKRGPTPPAEGSGASAPGGGSVDDAGGAGVHDRGGRIRAPIDPERDLLCCRLPLTDLGNAERWRVRYGADFRFCDVLGWFHWDGKRWKLLSEEKDRLPAPVMQSVFRTVRAIRNEASLVSASGYPPPEGLSDKELTRVEAWADAFGTAERETYLRGDEDGERLRWLEDLDPMDHIIGKTALWSQKIAAWAKTSEGAGKLQSVAGLAKSFPDIAITPEQLDADRHAINVANGTLRFRRVKERRSSEEVKEGKSAWRMGGFEVVRHPHDRADLITKLAPVEYRKGKACPVYDEFMARVQPDETMRRFIHQWGGYSLTGDTGEQKLAFFYGSGRNGKGTWVELVAHIAGDYAGSIPIESFLDTGGKRRGDQATPDIARLPGVRLLRVSEPEKGSALNEGLIKQVTGGDPVDARHLNKGFFTFLPDFKMTISGNHKPKVKDTSDGIWRRMQLVPWAVQIPAEEVDRKLQEKLRAEASGVLNRLLDGLIDWLEHGLIEPEAVRLATRAYRDASDDLGRFLSDLCEVSADHDHVRVGSQDLHKLYLAWAEAAGGATMHIKGFKGAMEGKGFVQKPSDGMKWLGVRPRAGVVLDDVKQGVWPPPPSADDDLDAANSAEIPPDWDDAGEVPF